jgi:ferredoxin
MKGQNRINTKITCRHFIKVTGTIILVAGTGYHLYASDEIMPSEGYLLVDKKKCIGYGACYDACPYIPSGTIVAADKDYRGRWVQNEPAGPELGKLGYPTN